jgi:integrase
MRPIGQSCEPSFRNLVTGALLTGCRYSETANLRAANFNADARESKAGKPRHVVLTDERQRLFAKLTAGKLADDAIFTRADGGILGKSLQSRPMLDACERASTARARWLGFRARVSLAC